MSLQVLRMDRWRAEVRSEGIREIVIVENLCMSGSSDTYSWLWSQTHAKLAPIIFKLREKGKTGNKSYLYTVTLTQIFE